MADLPSLITAAELGTLQQAAIDLGLKRGERDLPIDFAGGSGAWVSTPPHVALGAVGVAAEHTIAIDTEGGTGGHRVKALRGWCLRAGATPPEIDLYTVDLTAPGTFVVIGGASLVVTAAIGEWQYVEVTGLTAAVGAHLALWLRLVSSTIGDGFAGGLLTLDNP